MSAGVRMSNIEGKSCLLSNVYKAIGSWHWMSLDIATDGHTVDQELPICATHASVDNRHAITTQMTILISICFIVVLSDSMRLTLRALQMTASDWISWPEWRLSCEQS